MTTIQSGRRDPRYSVRSDMGTVEIDQFEVGLIRGTLRQISVSGVSFVLAATDFEPAPETRLAGVRLHIGECRLRGDVIVRHAKRLSVNELEIGGLFLPASNQDVQTLMVLISGISSARAD